MKLQNFDQFIGEAVTVSDPVMVDKLKKAMDWYNEASKDDKNDAMLGKIFAGSKVSSFFIYRASQMSNKPEAAYTSYVNIIGKSKVDAFIEKILSLA